MGKYYVNGSELFGRDEEKKYEYNASSDRFFEAGPADSKPKGTPISYDDYKQVLDEGRLRRYNQREDKRRSEELKALNEKMYYDKHTQKEEDIEAELNEAKRALKKSSPFYKLMHRKQRKDDADKGTKDLIERGIAYFEEQEKSGRGR